MSSQPWNMPSAGSVFRNPENKSAWQYIDECGLRGYEISGAQVSPKHSKMCIRDRFLYHLLMQKETKSMLYNRSKNN